MALQPGTDVRFAFALYGIKRLGVTTSAVAQHVSGYDDFMTEARALAADKQRGKRVASADIRRLAEWMAEANPLVLHPVTAWSVVGMAVAASVLHALPALLGKLDATAASCSAQQCFSEDPREAAASRSLPPELERSTSSMLADIWSATISICCCGPCSSTITTPSPPTKTD
jgi:hypothetical protein